MHGERVAFLSGRWYGGSVLPDTMPSYRPPVFRGKIATTPGRLLLAAAVMLALDLLLFPWQGVAVVSTNFFQVAALVGVLLFSPRRWVALLLMLPIWYLTTPVLMSLDDWERYWHFASALIPLWAGVFIAFPRPRKRWVYVEEEEKAEN